MPQPAPAIAPAGRSPRLISLDAFRGATVAAMLLVNNPGSWSDVYAPLDHAPWNGCTFTDLIFPAFLWMVGLSLSLSFRRRVEAGDAPGLLFRHALRRSAIIFALGLLLATFPFGLLSAHHFSPSHLRIPGVLQRIAVCYFAASAIGLRTGPRGQVAWLIALLVASAALLNYFPVPGYGPGHLEPLGNFAWWVDSHLLAGHTWASAPAPGFDPEGIVSTLPALATTLCGALAGRILLSPASPISRATRLLGSGLALLAIGWLLSLWLPLNKNLWTSSFAVFTAGWATLGFTLFFWLIEVRGWRRWATPFVIYGMNAIVLFVLSGLIGRLLIFITWDGPAGKKITLKGFLYQDFFAPLASPVNASLLFALAFVFALFLVAWAMWRRKWFIKI